MEFDAQVVKTLKPWFPDIDISGVHIVTSGPVCWFVRSVLHQGAMTVSPYIFFGRHEYDPSSGRSVALVAHELRHVEQYRKYGHIGFLARYFRDLARNRGKYSPDLPLEAECYELQARVQQALPQNFV
jgi:Domain of unknown function (DUF4157)